MDIVARDTIHHRRQRLPGVSFERYREGVSYDGPQKVISRICYVCTMVISRRKAISMSGTLAGLSVTAAMLQPARVMAQGGPPSAGAQQPFPDKLVEQAMRPGFPVDLPLLPDGSAPEHNRNEAGAVEGPLMWRTSDRKTPSSIVADYKQMAIRVETSRYCHLDRREFCRFRRHAGTA